MNTLLPLKTYVNVDAAFTAEGRLIPKTITWTDGQRYVIDRVLKQERAASRKIGGCGILYTCLIGGKQIHLYYEENYRWFVEARA